MSKEDRVIMAVEREALFKEGYFNGFCPANQTDFYQRILDNKRFMRRGEVEQNPALKQPIAYAAIVCSVPGKNLGKTFAYKRGKGEEYDEDRLAGNWSWGFGGHIQKTDDSGNPVEVSLLRELTEEAGLSENVSLCLDHIGYINDDSNEVGKVHFGVVYAVRTPLVSLTPGDKEIRLIELKSLSELEEICSSPQAKVDPWSRIMLEALKQLKYCT